MVQSLTVTWTQAQEPPPIQPEQARLSHTLAGLQGTGHAIAYASQAGMLLASSDDGAIHAWMQPETLGVRTGQQTPQVLTGHSGPVLALAVTPDGLLVSAGVDRKILMRSLPEGTVRAAWSGHSRVIRALAVSPDGKLIASGGDEGTILLWDRETGQVAERLSGHRSWVTALAFSADGHYLASVGYDQVLRVWNLASPDKLPVIPIYLAASGPAGIPLSVAFAPDSRTVAVGCGDGQIRLYRVPEGSLVRALAGHSSSVTSLAFHPAGNWLVSGSRDRTVRLWNWTNGQAVKSLEGHSAWVQGVCLVERGTMIASVAADRTVRLWDLRPPAK
jgi:WD40 repeat protein